MEIPPDIFAIAEKIHLSILGKGIEASVISIGKSILEERDRCASVAETHEFFMPIDWWLNATKKDVSEFTALSVARAIREQN